jgi:hypothetical protein
MTVTLKRLGISLWKSSHIIKKHSFEKLYTWKTSSLSLQTSHFVSSFPFPNRKVIKVLWNQENILSQANIKVLTYCVLAAGRQPLGRRGGAGDEARKRKVWDGHRVQIVCQPAKFPVTDATAFCIKAHCCFCKPTFPIFYKWR